MKVGCMAGILVTNIFIKFDTQKLLAGNICLCPRKIEAPPYCWEGGMEGDDKASLCHNFSFWPLKLTQLISSGHGLGVSGPIN